MLDYHLDSYMSRCALEIDIRKAFDIVSWDFILTGLRDIGVPGVMVKWIEVYMSTTYFFMAMNGENHGLFPSSKGLQQDDSLSSYFFVLAIKGLGGILKEDSQNLRFCYNWWWQHNAITHMCFTDDLMIYCQVDRDLVKYVRKVLDDFAGLSSLVINLEKSLSLLIRSWWWV